MYKNRKIIIIYRFAYALHKLRDAVHLLIAIDVTANAVRLNGAYTDNRICCKYNEVEYAHHFLKHCLKVLLEHD